MNIQKLFPKIDDSALMSIIRFVSHESKIDEGVLEKDIFLTGMLKKIQDSPDISMVYFKGGTCLSKCQHIIERFSEDCDLFVYTGNNLDSHTQEQRLNSRVVNWILNIFGDDQAYNENGVLEGRRGGDYNKLVFNYDKLFEPSGALMKPRIEFEVTNCALRDKTGYRVKHGYFPVQSIVGEFLNKNQFDTECERFGLQSFNVQCVLPYKTLCDKISRMIRVSYSDNLEADLLRYMRDVYDIGMLLRNKQIYQYAQSEELLKDMILVNREDSMRLNSHAMEKYSDARIFSDFDTIFSKTQIIDGYNQILETFVFGTDSPKFDELRKCFSFLRERFVIFDKVREKGFQIGKEDGQKEHVQTSPRLK